MRAGELAAALIDLVFPGDCAACGGPTHPWCPACAARLGSPCRLRVLGVPEVVAVGRYSGPLRAALLRYKERGRRDLAGPLADLLAGALEELIGRSPDVPSTLAQPVRWLVPVPSRPAAARSRGGDHVARLCRALAARRPDLRVSRPLRLGRRVRDSVGLDARQREANLAGRVRVLPAALPPDGALMLLVDDVVTTGATLRACRRALAGYGVRVDVALVLCDATPATAT